MLIEKPESVGILSNDKKSITSVDHQDQASDSDVGLLSDSYPTTNARSYNPVTSGAEPGYLTNQEKTPADPSTGGSCGSSDACRLANIGFVVGNNFGPSCQGFYSCYYANIGSVDGSCQDEFSCYKATIDSADTSCKGEDSCFSAQLSGVGLINSCNERYACKDTDGAFDEFIDFTELLDCCNNAPINDIGQCVFLLVV